MVATLIEGRDNIAHINDWPSQLFGFLFAVSLLFGAILVLNSLGLEFFFNFPRRISISLIDSSIDLLIWVSSSMGVSVLTLWSSNGRAKRTLRIGLALTALVLSPTPLLISHPSLLYSVAVIALFLLIGTQFAIMASKRLCPSSKCQRVRPPLVLVYILGFLVGIETSSAIYFVIRSLGSTTQIGQIDAQIELQLSYASYALIPWLYVAFLFSWLWVPLTQKLISRNVLSLISSKTHDDQDDLIESSLGNRLSKLFEPKFFLVLAVAVFIGYYPYLQNPPWLVGTDAFWRYYDPLVRMSGKGGFAGISQALDERHPVLLVLLYAAQELFQTSAFEVIRYTPLILIVSLAFATRWFVGAKARTDFGLIVFLMSILSITTTVGFYSSILANWMALACWVIFFAYVGLRDQKHLIVPDFLILFALSTLILLIHPWTWGVFATTVVLTAILAVITERRRAAPLAAMLLLVILINAIFAFLSITLLAQSQGWRVVEAIDLFTAVFRDPSTLLWFWDAVSRLAEIWAPFFNPVYLALSIMGVFCLRTSNLSSWRRSLIIGWLCVSAIGSILIAPVSFDPARPTESESQLWRMLFLTPFQLTAPFGIAWLIRRPNQLRSKLDVRETNIRTLLTGRLVWLGALAAFGVALAFAPVWGRFLLLLALLPITTALILLRSNSPESEFLSGALVLAILLVLGNSTMRSLTQLLLDPHNYRP